MEGGDPRETLSCQSDKISERRLNRSRPFNILQRLFCDGSTAAESGRCWTAPSAAITRRARLTCEYLMEAISSPLLPAPPLS